jgi:hypothetical protein
MTSCVRASAGMMSFTSAVPRQAVDEHQASPCPPPIGDQWPWIERDAALDQFPGPR